MVVISCIDQVISDPVASARFLDLVFEELLAHRCVQYEFINVALIARFA